MAAASACGLASPSAAWAARQEVERLQRIVATYRIDPTRAIQAVASLDVAKRSRYVCVVDAKSRVACAGTEEVIATATLSEADQNMLRMGLNDTLDLLSGDAAAGADVLIACGNAQSSVATDLLAASSKSLRGTGPMAPRTPLTPSQGKATGTGRPTLTSGSPPAATDLSTKGLVDACRTAQWRRIQDRIGALTPKDEGYARAVQTATSAMDAAVSSCRQPSNSAIANPTGTDATAATPPPNTEGSASAGGSGQGASSANSSQNSGEQVVSVLNLAIGLADTLATANDIVAPPTAAGVTQVVIGVVGLVAGAKDLGGSAAAGTAGNMSQVAGTVLTAITSGGEAVAASTAFLPAVGAGFAGYAAARLLNQVTGGALDRAAVEMVGIGADGWFNFTNNIGSTATGGAGRVTPDGGGRPSCSAIAQRWDQFRKYCSQPANNWQTYDCALFIARMNGCADPGLINPGPQGEATCRRNCSGGHAVLAQGAGSLAVGKSAMLGLQRSPGTCVDAATYECEQKSMIASAVRGRTLERPGACRDRARALDELGRTLSASIRSRICLAAQGDLCARPGDAADRSAPQR